MATVALSVPRSDSEHIVAAVREEQRAYTFKIAVSMALYACLFFVLAFCGPYVLPAITLFSDAPLTDRQVAASQLLLLSDTVWVAIPVFFLGAILFSLLVTRRVADALERLGQSARAWASGKVSHRLQFREADRLTDLAQLLNQGWSQVGQRSRDDTAGIVPRSSGGRWRDENHFGSGRGRIRGAPAVTDYNGGVGSYSSCAGPI